MKTKEELNKMTMKELLNEGKKAHHDKIVFCIS